MSFFSRLSRAGLLALALLVLVACGAKNASVSNSSPDKANTQKTVGNAKEPTEPEDFNWTIYVQDSSTISMGPMKMDLSIDLKAVNTSGQIYGQYIGSAKTKANSHAENVAIKKGVGSMTAPVEGSSTSLVININPAVADNDKLAPLTEPDPDDDKLAPLVPNDDDKLAPLTDPNSKVDYEGSGSMTIVSSGTATATVRGYSASKGIGGKPSVNPLKVTIIGSQVRLEVQIPEIGTVYFDGFIRGEPKGEATEETQKEEADEPKAEEPKKEEPKKTTTTPKKTAEPNEDDALAPLVPNEDDALAPLVPNEDDALAPLVPNEDDALAPLVP